MTDRGSKAATLALELRVLGECIDLIDDCLRDEWELKFRYTRILDRFMYAHPGANREDIAGAIVVLRKALITEGPVALIDYKAELIKELRGDDDAN